MARWLIAIVTLCAAATAHAQDSADAHFRSGLRAYEQGHYDTALAELSRAYDLDPAPATLYNLGLVHARLGHAVESADFLTRFLATPADPQLRTQRRTATTELAQQRALIATLHVVSDVPAAVTVGDHDVGTTPFDLRVTSGHVVVGVHAAGYEPERREIEVAGGDDRQVRFELRALRQARGTLTIDGEHSLADVDIYVDGERRGRTVLHQPMPLTLPAGRHAVEGRRAGYVTWRDTVEIVDGIDTPRTVTPVQETVAGGHAALGVIELRLPEDHFAIQIDGTPATLAVSRFQIPAGSHRVHVEVADRIPVDLDVNVEADRTQQITPPLRWTPEGRAHRRDAARLQAPFGIAITAGAGVLAVAGAILWAVTAMHGWGTHATHLREQRAYCAANMIECAHVLDWDDGAARSELGVIEGETAYWGIGAGVATLIALVGAAVGLPLWLSTPSDADIDRAAHARLRVGPSGLTVDW